MSSSNVEEYAGVLRGVLRIGESSLNWAWFAATCKPEKPPRREALKAGTVVPGMNPLSSLQCDEHAENSSKRGTQEIRMLNSTGDFFFWQRLRLRLSLLEGRLPQPLKNCQRLRAHASSSNHTHVWGRCPLSAIHRFTILVETSSAQKNLDRKFLPGGTRGSSFHFKPKRMFARARKTTTERSVESVAQRETPCACIYSPAALRHSGPVSGIQRRFFDRVRGSRKQLFLFRLERQTVRQAISLQSDLTLQTKAVLSVYALGAYLQGFHQVRQAPAH